MSNPRRTNGHRRTQLRNRVLAEETTCWLCHRRVDKNIKTPDNRAPEVHEIIPVTRGGSPYDRDNCTLTHRACNRWIGNRTPNELADKQETFIQASKPITTIIKW